MMRECRAAVVGRQLPVDLLSADTVGIIFDVDDGLGYYEDFGLLWSADADALLRRHKPGYQGVPDPGVRIVPDRLRPYVDPDAATDAGKTGDA